MSLYLLEASQLLSQLTDAVSFCWGGFGSCPEYLQAANEKRLQGDQHKSESKNSYKNVEVKKCGYGCFMVFFI